MKKVLFISNTNYNFKDEKASSYFKKKFEDLGRETKIYVLAKGEPVHKKIWGTDFYLLKPRIFFWSLAFFVGFYLCLSKKIDTLIAQSPLMEGFTATLLKKILKKELIVEVHGDWVEATFLSKKRKFEKIQRKVVPILAKFSLKSADKIRVVSKYLAGRAKEIVPKKDYFLFPAFTDLDMFLAERDIRFKNFILFVGVLEKVKGIDYLIRAFNEIKNEFPQFKLVIVGEGSERENYQLSIINYQLQDRVEFKGKLSLTETKDIMKNCSCLILPSLSEGLGRVLLEAMALGKPVVGSKVGGIPDLIKDGQNGFLFEKGNSEELTEKLKVLLNDKNLAIKMGKKGKEFIRENFSNEKYIQNYIEMINA